MVKLIVISYIRGTSLRLPIRGRVSGQDTLNEVIHVPAGLFSEIVCRRILYFFFAFYLHVGYVLVLQSTVLVVIHVSLIELLPLSLFDFWIAE